MHSPQDLIGRTLHGKFVMTDLLGVGAMGIVYRGFDDETLDEVAIKVLQPDLAGNADVVSRFHREASAARRVDHEGTVRVLGRGSEGGIHYLVMELLRGRSLAAVLAEGPRLTEGRAARIIIQLCGALAVAHDRGVVHRDIKPENIMVIEGGDQLGERVKLLDFGIAKRLSPANQRPGGIEDSFNSGDETRHGALLGTPEYMAPEQCMGRDVDQRTDIYACGVLLYRMVTGQVPFDGVDVHPFELCQRHIGEEPAPPRALVPWIKPAMEAVILKALSKAPDARQQSAGELRDELVAVLADIEQIEMERTARFSLHDDDDLADLVPSGPVAISAAIELPVATLAPAPMPEGLHPAEPGSPVGQFDLAPPVPPAPETQRGSRRSKVYAYLSTVAVAAMIGAGLGSLFMALAPLLQR